MANEENKEKNAQSFVQKVLEKLNRILHRYMKGFRHYNELQEFMKDEKNLYNEDGTLTEEYKKRIAELEEYAEKTSIDESVKAEVLHSETDEKVYQGIVNFINYRWSLIKEYDKEENEFGSDFSAEDFLKRFIDRNTSSEEERKHIKEAMEKIAAEEALEELEDENVRQALREMINETKEEEEVK